MKHDESQKVVYLSKIRKMKSYRFRTRVSRTGIIQVPDSASLQDKEVDVILVPRIKPINEKSNARSFVEKWTGFLNVTDTDLSKYAYLSEKYK